jgi:hypothetical protein
LVLSLLDRRKEMKNGFLTSEFILSLAAVVLGAIMAAGVLPAGGMAAQIVGGVMAVLAGLGYTASRTQVKVADITTPADPVPAPKPPVV